MALDQLVEELSREENKGTLKKVMANGNVQLDALTKTNKTLNKIVKN